MGCQGADGLVRETHLRKKKKKKNKIIAHAEEKAALGGLCLIQFTTYLLIPVMFQALC